MLIEGYASRFGIADLAGDEVRAGAFHRSLARKPMPRMLLQHKGPPIGHWHAVHEDGRGLLVRGEVDHPSTEKLIEQTSLNGLSIGFIARDWTPKVGAGRTLIALDLIEISLVAEPMLPSARFDVLARDPVRAIA